MSVSTPGPTATGFSRSARLLPWGYTAIALLMAQLPSLFPPRLPQLVAPTWYATAAACGLLALLILLRPKTSSTTLFSLGWAQAILTMVNAFVIGDIVAMFCTWLSVPALALLAGQIGVKGRKALLATHVITAGIWLGVAVMFQTMVVVAMSTTDIVSARVIYELLVIFDLTLLPIANFAASLSGIALGLTTKWGLLRYYWVAIKFFIPPVILFAAFGFLHDSLDSAAEQAARLAANGGAVAHIDAAADAVFWGFGAAMLALFAAMLLSLYKPWGRTPRGKKLRTKTARGQDIPVTVTDTRRLADDTTAFTLRSSSGDALAPWQPGAHIDLVLPSGKVRQYSLYGDPSDPVYRVAVLREPHGRGGSEEIHHLTKGAKLAIRGPRNNFPLVEAPEYVFIAGGIGVVPFLPMLASLTAQGAKWRLIYRGQNLSKMAFASALAHQYPDQVSLVPSDAHPRPVLRELWEDTPAGVAVYCCGPAEMVSAVAASVPSHAVLRVERFAATEREEANNTPFEAELRQSGVTVTVPAEDSLLSAIQQVDPTIDRSCEDGVCGSCRTRVLAGVPEHRDDVLQPHERQRTDIIYPCVSRSHGGHITLDV